VVKDTKKCLNKRIYKCSERCWVHWSAKARSTKARNSREFAKKKKLSLVYI